MKVRSVPHLNNISGESGINTVVRKYFEYMPRLGVKLVEPDSQDFDLLHVHAGMTDVYPRGVPIVSSLHGLYWTADYDAPGWEWRANQRVIKSIRAASVVTVPSEWVGETLKRDMHLDPLVVPHGIDWELWQHDYDDEGYVIAYAKNRAWADVSIPAMATDLARERENIRFVATFAQEPVPRNMQVTGVLSHARMRRVVQRAAVFVSPVKETFGIAALEAMAAGVPVLTVDAGQVPQLVQHGVGGYCYQEENMEDMVAGLDYCLRHRRTLGANARELAKQYPWEKAVEKMKGAYDLALGVHTGTVGVVIPVYNKDVDQVARAIDSVLAQSRSADQIIVVDDGSTNGSQLAALCESKGVTYYRQENKGVAHARNAGIEQLDTEYVVCLDADDAIDPEFLEVCSNALDEDHSLYIAYTKIKAHMPDGSTQVSQWPGQYDFDQFLERRNQIPTCCMFRRVMWERLGGYRQRYAPTGAGAEDAEFWFRAGGMGYRGELVTSKPLFLYSMGAGHTSKSGYRETDWLSWHAPWLRDRHPFASLASPVHNTYSHPVRQYDDPLVSVVIPVGPSHAGLLWQVLDSLEAQTFSGWEAIVVNDTGDALPQRLLDAYPFVRWVQTEGAQGAGAARNRGAEQARGHLLLFIDADDWIYPEFLERTTLAWKETENAIYTDYIGIAYVSDPAELSDSLRRDLLDYDPDTNQAIIRYRPKEYLCERAMRQPEEGNRPYLWCNITTLLPKRWHDEIGGFDEEIASWEDVDYWWRIAKAGYCFTRVEEPLMVYRFHTGKRRDSALRQFPKLLQYLQRKHEDIDTMGCDCSGRKTDPATHRALNAVNGRSAQGVEMQDRDYVMVTYLSTNQGQHPVYGTSTREFYGYRSGGEKFLVHRDDVSGQPHLFRVIREERVTNEMKEPRPVGAPQPVTDEVGESLASGEPDSPDSSQPDVDTEEWGLDEEEIQEILASHTPLNLADLDLRKEAIQNLAAKGIVTEEAVLERGVEGLQDIKWVGEATAIKLVNMVRAKRDMEPLGE